LLEQEALDIGIVSGIQGSRWFVVEITGASAHAGTAPVSVRRDAVQDMVRAIIALNALTADPADVLRFTVARIEVHPNTSNSVAERVRFTIDLRHPDAAVLIPKGDAIEPTIRAAVKHCEVAVTERFHALPVEFDPLVTGAVERAATAHRAGRHGAGAEGEAHALRRLPRRAVHGAALPERDALRPLPRRGQP
jgi:beta-ureidopropionase / N-carbamoyl-L-amino-acid hydrolase